MITSAELEQLRTEANRLLTATCTIVAPGSPVSDGAGGWTDGTPTTTGPFACSIRMPRAGVEEETAARLQLSNPWVVLLPAGTDIPASSHIIIGAKTYEVSGIIEGGTREILRRALAVERES